MTENITSVQSVEHTAKPSEIKSPVKAELELRKNTIQPGYGIGRSSSINTMPQSSQTSSTFKITQINSSQKNTSKTGWRSVQESVKGTNNFLSKISKNTTKEFSDIKKFFVQVKQPKKSELQQLPPHLRKIVEENYKTYNELRSLNIQSAEQKHKVTITTQWVNFFQSFGQKMMSGVQQLLSSQ